MMKPTPRTDAACFMLGSPKADSLKQMSEGEFTVVDSEFARTLERERDEAMDLLRELLFAEKLDDDDYKLIKVRAQVSTFLAQLDNK